MSEEEQEYIVRVCYGLIVDAEFIANLPAKDLMQVRDWLKNAHTLLGQALLKVKEAA